MYVLLNVTFQGTTHTYVDRRSFVVHGLFVVTRCDQYGNLMGQDSIMLSRVQVICIPFAWGHEAVTPITYDSQDWVGTIADGWGWYYADYMLLLTFGGIPWQVYFQRVLSSRSAKSAETLSYIAAIGCFLMAVPPVLIGAIAKSTSESGSSSWWL